MAKKQTPNDNDEKPAATPEAGGSYTRDPQTGELILIERTEATAAVDDSEIPFDSTQE